MRNKIYINGIGSISAQPKDLLSGGSALIYHESIFPAVSPDYKEFVKPMALRRMSKAIKMGVTAAKIALKEADVEVPNAIITGTGEGCKLDTEKFLENMLKQEEKLLTPTSFIQSTHNTIGGQIALNLGCRNYNVTYTQNAVSLETAFLDAQMHFDENPDSNSVLVGGVDEISEKITSFKKLDNQLKSKPIRNIDLYKEDSKGTITSEGSHFFALSKEQRLNSYAEFQSISIKNTVRLEELNREIEDFLQSHGLDVTAIDLVILGVNGDNRYDHYYKSLQQNLFKDTAQLAYKHLVGDFDTISGFAVYLAASILKSAGIPEIFKLNKVECSVAKTILIYNQYLGRDHSLILLGAV